MRSYDSLLDASYALLGEVVEIVQPLDHQFVVVGGWSPYLLNSVPIRHPGTRDVDILFAEGASPGALRSVVQALLRRGFLPSAKHHFQLLRILRVRETDLIFNVDLLHPLESSRGDPSFKPEMFVDHIELAVPLSKYLAENYKQKSIATPHAGFILEDGRFVRLSLDFDLPDGRSSRIEVPLMDEVGLIVTKSQSISSPKRTRDAFDIYLAIAQSGDYGELVRAFHKLKKERNRTFISLYGIRAVIERSPDCTFGWQIEEFIPVDKRNLTLTAYPRNDPYADRIQQFLNDVTLDDRADYTDFARSPKL